MFKRYDLEVINNFPMMVEKPDGRYVHADTYINLVRAYKELLDVYCKPVAES